MAFTGRPALEGIDANKEGLDALAAKSLSVGARARLRREQAAAAAAAPPAAPSPPPVDVSGLSVGARARLRREQQQAAMAPAVDLSGISVGATPTLAAQQEVPQERWPRRYSRVALEDIDENKDRILPRYRSPGQGPNFGGVCDALSKALNRKSHEFDRVLKREWSRLDKQARREIWKECSRQVHARMVIDSEDQFALLRSLVMSRALPASIDEEAPLDTP